MLLRIRIAEDQALLVICFSHSTYHTARALVSPLNLLDSGYQKISFFRNREGTERIENLVYRIRILTLKVLIYRDYKILKEVLLILYFVDRDFFSHHSTTALRLVYVADRLAAN
jgi:hypothetical protein